MIRNITNFETNDAMMQCKQFVFLILFKLIFNIGKTFFSHSATLIKKNPSSKLISIILVKLKLNIALIWNSTKIFAIKYNIGLILVLHSKCLQ